MMEAAIQPPLRAVPDDAFAWPDGNGELLSTAEATERVRSLLDELATLQAKLAGDYDLRDAEDRAEGYRQTVDAQARRIGVLERKITEEEDPSAHPKGREIVAVIERWRTGSGHRMAKVSADRVKLVKARIRDGYPITSEQAEPTIELAVDGICAYPYVVNGRRMPAGEPSQRYDRLGIALAGGEKVEECSRLGWRARREGWTPQEGWPR